MAAAPGNESNIPESLDAERLEVQLEFDRGVLQPEKNLTRMKKRRNDFDGRVTSVPVILYG